MIAMWPGVERNLGDSKFLQTKIWWRWREFMPELRTGPGLRAKRRTVLPGKPVPFMAIRH